MNSTKFSAVIITLNEAEVIADTLSCVLQLADEVIVVDSGSTDDTRTIAENMGARVVLTEWKGYSATKNYGISLTSNDWIFCFDADEQADSELIQSIKTINPKSGNVYLMNRLTRFEGKAVKHGSWHPDWVVRLFNKQECHWNKSLVHESLEPLRDKKKVKLNGYLNHKSVNSQEEFDDKIDLYGRLKAQQWILNGKKPTLIKKIIGPQIRFFTSYVIKLGFLDGSLGYRIAKGEADLIRKQLFYYQQLK